MESIENIKDLVNKIDELNDERLKKATMLFSAINETMSNIKQIRSESGLNKLRKYPEMNKLFKYKKIIKSDEIHTECYDCYIEVTLEINQICDNVDVMFRPVNGGNYPTSSEGTKINNHIFPLYIDISTVLDKLIRDIREVSTLYTYRLSGILEGYYKNML